jgi:hypothetical protein
MNRASCSETYIYRDRRVLAIGTPLTLAFRNFLMVEENGGKAGAKRKEAADEAIWGSRTASGKSSN